MHADARSYNEGVCMLAEVGGRGSPGLTCAWEDCDPRLRRPSQLTARPGQPPALLAREPPVVPTLGSQIQLTSCFVIIPRIANDFNMRLRVGRGKGEIGVVRA